MANKGIAAFDEFIAGVLGAISDPDQKRKAEAAIGELKAIQPVAQALGDGVAGQSEIDRQLQTLKTQQEELDTLKTQLDERDQKLGQWHGQLTEWFAANKDALEKGKKPANGNGNPNPDDKKVPEGVLTKDVYDENIAGERAAFLGFSRDQNAITREHFLKFNEIVDLEPLLKHPQIAQVGLVGVYQLVHKDRLEKWGTDHTAAEHKKIADEAVRKFQETQAQMPYPSPTGAGSGSPLDALTGAGKPDSVTEAATAHYNRLQAERAGGTATK